MTIKEPLVGVGAFAAGVLGTYGYTQLSGDAGPNADQYFVMSYIFAQFAVMMIFGGFAHCLLSTIGGVMTSAMTTSIALTFMFLGFVISHRITTLNRTRFEIVLGVGIVLLAIVYYVSGWILKSWITFIVLYDGAVAIGCGYFAIVEAIMLLRKGASMEALAYLSGAVVLGGAGLIICTEPTSVYWLCENISPALSSQGLWYNLSVASMWCILKFFKLTTPAVPEL